MMKVNIEVRDDGGIIKTVMLEMRVWDLIRALFGKRVSGHVEMSYAHEAEIVVRGVLTEDHLSGLMAMYDEALKENIEAIVDEVFQEEWEGKGSGNPVGILGKEDE